MKIFVIHDQAAESYLAPFFVKTHAIAVRSIETLVADVNHQFFQHAEHFRLFLIGEFDEETGVITPCVPEFVIGCNDIAAKLHAESLEDV